MPQSRFTYFIVSCFCFLPLLIWAQPKKDETPGNLPKFYKRPIHFGFSIAYNKSDFIVHAVRNSDLYHNLTDSIVFPNDTLDLKSVYSLPQGGFSLGIVTDVRLHDFVRLRLVPNLTFSSRGLEYSFANKDTTIKVTSPTESAFIMVPLLLKVQSKRLRNFGAYVIGGGGYGYDLISNKKSKASKSIIRINQSDYFYEAGAGADFYMMYFKLSLEMKFQMGQRNMLIQDNQLFSKPLESLNSKFFFFTISFEG